MPAVVQCLRLQMLMLLSISSAHFPGIRSLLLFWFTSRCTSYPSYPSCPSYPNCPNCPNFAIGHIRAAPCLHLQFLQECHEEPGFSRYGIALARRLFPWDSPSNRQIRAWLFGTKSDRVICVPVNKLPTGLKQSNTPSPLSIPTPCFYTTPAKTESKVLYTAPPSTSVTVSRVLSTHSNRNLWSD